MTGAAAHAASVRGLVKRYGDRAVLRGVDLEVRRGELLALLGPNGAGKTTLVEILEGYRRPDGGSVDVLGAVPWRAGTRWRARIGLMLQDGGVDPRVTAREALDLFGRFFEASRSPDELLDLVGLRDVATTRYRRLSGGERQRLGLALALVGRPELLFLDEPTAGMDPAAKRATRALLRQLRSDGATILLTTHDLADVERVADRVAILHGGHIVALGTPAEVAAGGEDAVEIRFNRPVVASGLAGALAARWPLASVGADLDDPAAVLIHGVAPVPELVAAVAGWALAEELLIAELRAGSGGLEAQYLALTGDVEVAS